MGGAGEASPVLSDASAGGGCAVPLLLGCSGPPSLHAGGGKGEGAQGAVSVGGRQWQQAQRLAGRRAPVLHITDRRVRARHRACAHVRGTESRSIRPDRPAPYVPLVSAGNS